LYAVLVVPGALLLHVIVVTMFSAPLASSESLCVVFGGSDAQAQCEDRTQREPDTLPEGARRLESPARVS
jgi:hypothetical protein